MWRIDDEQLVVTVPGANPHVVGLQTGVNLRAPSVNRDPRCRLS